MVPLKKVLMRLPLIGRDAQRVLREVDAFLRYLRSKEDVEVGLGLFAAASHVAVIGQPNRYEVRVASASRDSRDVMLVVDIYAVDLPRHPEGHYGWFTKHLSVKRGTSRTIAIEYDWLATPCVLIDDVPSPPDAIWRGQGHRPQLYSVTATLFDMQRTQLDSLTIYQELTG
jgi:hypothetical protein